MAKKIDVHSSKKYYYVPQTDHGKKVRKSQLELKKNVVENGQINRAVNNYKKLSPQDLSELYFANSAKTVFSSINRAVENGLKYQNMLFYKKYDFRLNNQELKFLNSAYNPNSTFIGSNLVNRLRIIERQNRNNITLIKNNPDLTDTQKKNALKNLFSGNQLGQNGWRPTSRILISEQNRANQTSAKIYGEYLASAGYKVKFIWHLSTLPGRKYDICDEYAAKKYYTLDTLPDTPHPFCLEDGTECLTKEGWKDLKDVTENDFVLAMNPGTKEIDYVKVNQPVRYWYEGKMVVLETKHYRSVSIPEHRVPIEGIRNKKFEIVEAQDLYNRDFSIPKTGTWNSNKKYDANLIKLWGWVVSEGSVNKRWLNSYQLSIPQFNPEKYKRIENILIATGLPYGKGKNCFYINGQFAKEVYSYFGNKKSHNKYVPDFIKGLSSDLIEIFLEEFLQGDGYTRTRPFKGFFSTERVYYTSSKKLVSDLCELIFKIGKSPSYSIIHTKGTKFSFSNGLYTINNDVYCIRELNTKRTNFNSAKKRGKVYSKDYSGYVNCIELEKWGIFCFKDKDSNLIGWTGNCYCWIEVVMDEESSVEAKKFAEYEDLDYKKGGWKTVNDILSNIEDYTYKVRYTVKKINQIVTWSNTTLETLNDPSNIQNYFNFSRDTLNVIGDYSETLADLRDIVKNIESISRTIYDLPSEVADLYSTIRRIFDSAFGENPVEKVQNNLLDFKRTIDFNPSLTKEQSKVLNDYYTELIKKIKSFQNIFENDYFSE